MAHFSNLNSKTQAAFSIDPVGSSVGSSVGPSVASSVAFVPMKPKAVLRDWYFKPKRSFSYRIQLVGLNVLTPVESFEQVEFCTAVIKKRLEKTLLQTDSGSLYRLEGPCDAAKMELLGGYLQPLIRVFRAGFPANWKEYLKEDLDRREYDSSFNQKTFQNLVVPVPENVEVLPVVPQITELPNPSLLFHHPEPSTEIIAVQNHRQTPNQLISPANKMRLEGPQSVEIPFIPPQRTPQRASQRDPQRDSQCVNSVSPIPLFASSDVQFAVPSVPPVRKIVKKKPDVPVALPSPIVTSRFRSRNPNITYCEKETARLLDQSLRLPIKKQKIKPETKKQTLASSKKHQSPPLTELENELLDVTVVPKKTKKSKNNGLTTRQVTAKAEPPKKSQTISSSSSICQQQTPAPLDALVEIENESLLLDATVVPAKPKRGRKPKGSLLPGGPEKTNRKRKSANLDEICEFGSAKRTCQELEKPVEATGKNKKTSEKTSKKFEKKFDVCGSVVRRSGRIQNLENIFSKFNETVFDEPVVRRSARLRNLENTLTKTKISSRKSGQILDEKTFFVENVSTLPKKRQSILVATAKNPGKAQKTNQKSTIKKSKHKVEGRKRISNRKIAEKPGKTLTLKKTSECKIVKEPLTKTSSISKKKINSDVTVFEIPELRITKVPKLTMNKTKPPFKLTSLEEEEPHVEPVRKNRTITWFRNTVKQVVQQKPAGKSSLLTKILFPGLASPTSSDFTLPEVNWDAETVEPFEPLNHTDTTRTFRMSAAPKRRVRPVSDRDEFEPSNAQNAMERLNFQGFLQQEKANAVKKTRKADPSGTSSLWAGGSTFSGTVMNIVVPSLPQALLDEEF